MLESGSTIGNPGQTIQPQGGMGFGSQVMPMSMMNFMMAIRQQMDESYHDMVNTLT